MTNRLLILFSSILFLSACSPEKPAQLRIALSKGSPDTSYANYYNWVEKLDSTVICLDMYDMPEDSALEIFRSCSGLILTGGTDIHPGFYGKAYDTTRCWPVDDHRDRLEMRLIDSALAWNMPILGICRGHQMLNVALGGSLIVDIPSDFDTLVTHQCEDYVGCYHDVILDTTSLLFAIAGVYSGEVTSNHHQAAERIAPGLKISSHAADGLIESLEWKNPEGKAFLLGVQWHPERMEFENPLSGLIGKKFVKEVTRHSSLVISSR